MTIPILSIIIQTHNRPLFLHQAISSALQAVPHEAVEVIVVPNGPNESWKKVAESFKHDRQIQWHPISKANANAARNAGKRIASGKYLWFLDHDDDFLSDMEVLGSTSMRCGLLFLYLQHCTTFYHHILTALVGIFFLEALSKLWGVYLSASVFCIAHLIFIYLFNRELLYLMRELLSPLLGKKVFR